MTGAELMAVVGFFVMLLTAIGAYGRRVENKVKDAKDKAMRVANSASLKSDLVSAQLQELRVHVASEYVSKSGQRDLIDQVMAALDAVVRSVDSLSGRVDRILENQAKTRPRT